MELGVTAVMLPEIGFEEQVELCASLGIRYYQYRPRHIPEAARGKLYSPWGNHRFDLTPERLEREGRELTAALERAGLRPWGTLPTASPADRDEQILLHLRGAVAAGAGRIRLSPPPYSEGIFDYRAYLDGVLSRYEEIIRKLSRPLGIRLLIETHTGGAAASPGLAWNIVRHFDPADIGVIFDIANFACEGEIAPSLAVSVLRDWIDCVHVGASRRQEAGNDDAGWRRVTPVSCPLVESDLHIPTWIAALAEARIDPPLIIEDFASDASGPERLERDARALRGVAGVRCTPRAVAPPSTPG